jgi:drug/metabolite transporter (DMT)-like permease
VATGDVAADVAAFWFLAAFIPLAAALYAAERFGWDLSAPAWLLVALQGATYGVGNLSLLAAFRNGGKASVVAPLSGLYPVVTIPLAILFFSESVGGREWAGIGLALAAGAALSVEPRREAAGTKKVAVAQTTNPGGGVQP